MSHTHWTQEEIDIVLASDGVPAARVGATIGRSPRAVMTMRLRLRNGERQAVLKAEPICSIEGCEVRHYARGWCRRHWRVWRKHGDAAHNYTRPKPGPEDGVCVVPDCHQPVRSGGGSECSAHHQRRHKYGTYELPPPKPPGTPRIEIGRRRTDKYGYVFVFRPDRTDTHRNGYISEHRMVMADHLGRALLPEESVHHRNGIRDDNRIENLELWVGIGRQPTGARAIDLLRWARELIEQYEGEEDLLRR